MWHCKRCNNTKFNQIIIEKLEYKECEFDENGYRLLGYKEKENDFTIVIKCGNCQYVAERIKDIAIFKK